MTISTETLTENRFKRIGISIDLFTELCTAGWKVGDSTIIECVRGLPEGAEYRWSWVDDCKNIVWLAYYHPSFEDVPLGVETPLLDIGFKKTRTE